MGQGLRKYLLLLRDNEVNKLSPRSMRQNLLFLLYNIKYHFLFVFFIPCLLITLFLAFNIITTIGGTDSVMLYFSQLLFLFIIVFNSVFANPNCSKNAWVKIYTQEQYSGEIAGYYEVTSGKDNQDITEFQLGYAFSTCWFKDLGCGVYSSSKRFVCNINSPWGRTKYLGTGNIEFSCSGTRIVSCNNVLWNTYE